VLGSRQQYGLLFGNLVSNAISYSREGGQVDIAAADGPLNVTVTVTDYGIGISEKALPHIFEEYYRSGEAAWYNEMSTGIGMAIVKQVALNFGLDVEVSSEQGMGTRVRVVLPRAPRSEAPAKQ
jgi:signal transduction histidine kinase